TSDRRGKYAYLRHVAADTGQAKAPAPQAGRYHGSKQEVRIRFLTSTPLDIRRGSGTYVGIYVLARALQQLGHVVDFESPRRSRPISTLQRLMFNRSLQPSTEHDLTVGFDMDGYRIASGSPRHVASLKGVIADEIRFERGLTQVTMSMQARREQIHA